MREASTVQLPAALVSAISSNMTRLLQLFAVWDTDGDGTPDHQDLDSDDDGRPDADEGMGDEDCDGVLNWVDNNDADGECPDEDSGGLEFREGTLPADRDSCGGSKSWALPLGLAVLGLAGLRRRRREGAIQ